MESITERICKQVEEELQNDLDKLFGPIRERAYDNCYNHKKNTTTIFSKLNEVKLLFIEQELKKRQDEAIKEFMQKVEGK